MVKEIPVVFLLPIVCISMLLGFICGALGYEIYVAKPTDAVDWWDNMQGVGGFLAVIVAIALALFAELSTARRQQKQKAEHYEALKTALGEEIKVNARRLYSIREIVQRAPSAVERMEQLPPTTFARPCGSSLAGNYHQIPAEYVVWLAKREAETTAFEDLLESKLQFDAEGRNAPSIFLVATTLLRAYGNYLAYVEPEKFEGIELEGFEELIQNESPDNPL